jgi:hypothetical protein
MPRTIRWLVPAIVAVALVACSTKSAPLEGFAYAFALVQEEIEQGARRKLAAIVGPDTGQPPKTTAVVKASTSPA